MMKNDYQVKDTTLVKYIIFEVNAPIQKDNYSY